MGLIHALLCLCAGYQRVFLRFKLILNSQRGRRSVAWIHPSECSLNFGHAHAQLARRLIRLDRRMRAALEDLSRLLDDDQRKLLTRSQKAWEAYRDRMTEYAGAPWGIGTMRPFIEAGIQSRMTKQRAAELEEELASLRTDPE